MIEKKKFSVGSVNCGSDELFLISGPCVVESEEIMMRTAEKVKEVSEKLRVGCIFKSSFQKDNRSSAEFYSGPGMEEGLELLAKVKQRFELPILTDVHHVHQTAPAAEVADVIQIPAYLAMQTDLALAAAATGRVVNLKHAQFLAPENMAKPVAKVESAGNDKILLTERGYAFGYNDLVVDPRSFYHLAETGYPVIFDATHSIRKYGIPSADPRGGARQYLPVLARAAVGAGVDGLFVETHPNPSQALCDAASQLDVNELEEFLKPLIEIHSVEIKYR